MVRMMYVWVLRLHPDCFRRRFGAEMLDIFDQSAECKWTWLFDAFVSLLRQWTIRHNFSRPLLAAAVPEQSSFTPVFRSLDSDKPPSFALVDGAVVSIAVFAVFAFAMSHGAIRGPVFLIGVHHPSPHLLAVDRSSVQDNQLTTTVSVAPEPEDPWRAIASVYFKLIRVLRTLDADGDFIISPWETITAPAALQKLDTDHDGKLSAEECGFSLDPHLQTKLDPDFVSRARLAFMRGTPVLAALDSDHDGEISAAEITNSSVALESLDRNHDGTLTPDEVIPDNAANQAMMILSRLDTDGDEKISRGETGKEDAIGIRELVQSADRDHDGFTTKQELVNELRFREERKREFDRAKQIAGFSQRR